MHVRAPVHGDPEEAPAPAPVSGLALHPDASLSSVPMTQALLACALVYVAITAAGVLQAGLNSDDWRHLLHGTSRFWAENEGRWGMDLVYRFVLFERPQLPLQLLLAFLCFAGTSALLATYVARPEQRPVGFVLIFSLGVNHVYMVDMLHFDSHVFSNALAIALSMLAFHVARSAALSVRGAARVVGSSQLLAASAAIYQPYALAGLLIPALIALRIERADRRQALGQGVCFAVMGALGVLFYKLEEGIFLWVTQRSVVLPRFEAPTLGFLWHKAAVLPRQLLELHQLHFVSVPAVFSAALGLFSLAIVVFAIAIAVHRVSSEREHRRDWSRGLGILVGTSAALVALPGLVLMLNSSRFVAGRIVGYFGFVLSSVFLGLLSTASIPPWIRRAGVLLLGAASTAMALAASQLWSDQARAGQRDLEMARAIYARVASQPGYDGTPFYLASRLSYADLNRRSSLGNTVFSMNQPHLGIFAYLFNLPWEPRMAPFSPRACPAFPAEQSVFTWHGKVYVCLTPFDAFQEPADCVESHRAGRPVRVCLTEGYVLWLEQDCRSQEWDSMQAVTLVSGDRRSLYNFDWPQERAAHGPFGPGCVRAVRRGASPFDRIEIGELHPDSTPIWTESFPAP